MFHTRIQRAVLVMTLLVSAGFLAVMSGCSGGDTDDSTDNGTPYVSDGGAGATIRIEIDDTTLNVGDETHFLVRLTDPQGAPLARLRVFCESEKGIAIIEPSSGGVAFEHTNANGIMSGVIGALLPGSYMMECRGPQGFNLVERVSLMITGDIPDGFEGWPGAAGGNLGGGTIVDITPDVEEGLTVSIRFQDAAGTSDAGPLDLSQGTCTGGSPETWSTPRYVITISNAGTQDVTLDAVEITVGGTTESVDTILNVPSGTSNSYTGVLPNAGTAGTKTVSVELGLTAEDGETFTLSGRTTVTISDLNRCPTTTPTATPTP